MRPRFSQEEFVQAVQRRIEATRVPIGTELVPGVRVLDAMAARGLAFRVLFVLGLNESVFPRVIREDAFLRDRERRVLETSLGYKIPEKLGGGDGEGLLFSAPGGRGGAPPHAIVVPRRVAPRGWGTGRRAGRDDHSPPDAREVRRVAVRPNRP